MCGWDEDDRGGGWRTIHHAPPTVLAAEAEPIIEQLVAQAWTRGWQPVELGHQARRHDARTGRVVALAITADHRRRDPATLHPQWEPQVESLGIGRAAPGWLFELVSRDSPVDEALGSAVFGAVLTLNMLRTLPSIVPPLVWSRTAKTAKPVTLRVPIDDPYADQKMLLLHIVAQSSQCRAVFHTAYGLVSIVGFPSDVAACELLFTSLLVQSQAAMQAESASAPAGSHERSRRFRSSFLQAYAYRIDARLGEINKSVREAITAERAALPAAEPSLLPVLVERQEAIDATVDELFGELRSRSFTRRFDADGWVRGDAAGQRAELNPAVAASPRPVRRRALAS